MTLRRKTILALSITLIGLILLLYVLLRVIMVGSFTMLERQVTLRNLSRATNFLQNDVDQIASAIKDWSKWDDAYQFASDGNQHFIDTNITDSTLWALHVNLMMFVNTANQIVYTKAVDLDPFWQDNLLPIFETYARDDARFLRLTTGTMTAGLVEIAGYPFLIASDMIVRSDESGPSTGTIIWATRISPQRMAEMSQTMRTTTELYALGAPEIPTDIRTMQNRLTPVANQDVAALDDNTVGGYALINDIYDQPSLLLRTTAAREIFAQGQVSLNYFMVALVLVSIIFGAGVLLLLERLVLLPLARLSESVRYVNVEDDFATRMPIKGDHELAQVAIAINTMLSRLSHTHTALYESNTKLEIGVNERTAELESQRSQMQTIMDTMGEGLVYSVDGVITYVNRAFAGLLNYQLSDIVGKPFAHLIALNEPAQMPVFVSALQRFETGLKRQDGSVVRVAITSSPVKQNDTRTRYVIIVRDITQELANKAQRDNFFARASHDLRAPLTSLMTRLYLLSKKPEQLDTHLKVLNQVSNQMLELVNDLLDVSRLEQPNVTLHRREMVLQTLIEQVVEVEQADAEMKRIRLQAEMEDTPLHIMADSMRMNQVITNLITNAIRYTPDGGEVTVKVVTETRKDEKCAVIHVADTGIGIPAEHINHIFDAFFRVSNERGGSGLGLYIVREIVELHGGEISVTSEVNQGTTFTVCLKLSGSDSPMSGEKSAAATSA
jgi:PAS domain S-box-containing protein